MVLAGFFASAATQAAQGKLKVVATTSIIGDFLRVVGSDDLDLNVLVGPGGDPHEYEPVPSDSIRLARADLIFENGLGLETWLDKLCSSAQTHAIRVVVTDGIKIRHVLNDEGRRPNSDADDRDPHAWQNVANAVIMVHNIESALAKSDPAHAAGYKTRAAAYEVQLNELDDWVARMIHTIPPQQRKLVTSHDAFGYFGDRYGIDVSRSALESVTTEASDPSARQIVEVVKKIKSSGVPVIFVENVQNPRLIQQIAAEAHVAVGPPLYSDALGPADSDGATYLDMIRHNVATLVNALKGSPAP